MIAQVFLPPQIGFDTIEQARQYGPFAIPDTGILAIQQDLPLQVVADCPFMTLDIGTARLRRCFPGTYTVYCSLPTATAILSPTRTGIETDTAIPFAVQLAAAPVVGSGVLKGQHGGHFGLYKKAFAQVARRVGVELAGQREQQPGNERGFFHLLRLKRG